jgi:hypothetical protein
MDVKNLTPDGFKTYGNKVIGYVKDSTLYLNSPEIKIMIEKESDIEELAPLLPPGTQFFLAGSQQTWQLGADGTASKSEIPGTFYLDPDTMELYYTPEVTE